MANPWVAGKYGLDIDGGGAGGFLKSCSGGDCKAEVIAEAASFGNVTQKHLGLPKYTPFKVTFAAGMSAAIQTMANNLLAFAPKAVSGAMHELSHDGMKIMRTTQFFDAFLTSFTVPKLSAESSKEPLYFSMELQPSRCRKVNGDGKQWSAAQNKVQKAYSSANFLVAIDGIPATTKYRMVDGIKVNHKPVEDADGAKREYVYVAGPVTFSDEVTFEVSADTAEPFFKWHEDYVIKGAGSDITKHEKSGSITVQSNDNKEELFKVELMGLGIKEITSPEMKDGADQKAATVTVKCYIEQFKIVAGKTVAG